MTEPIVTTGKFFVDNRGAGRIYLKKKVVNALSLKSGDEVRLQVYPDQNIIIVSRVDSEPIEVVFPKQAEEIAEWERRKEEAIKALTDSNFIAALLSMRDELDTLKKEIEELKKRV